MIYKNGILTNEGSKSLVTEPSVNNWLVLIAVVEAIVIFYLINRA
jgi:hypothetical protein